MDKRDGRSSGGMSRRDALKTAGATGVAIAWATPVVQTINISSAAAQASGTGFSKPAGGTRLTSITVKYLGGQVAHGPGGICDGSGTASVGVDGQVDDPVTVYALWGAGGNQTGGYPDSDCTTATGIPDAKTNVSVGDQFTFGDGVTGMSPRIELLVVDADDDCTLTKIHTSCSVAINTGDVCGQWEVVTATQ